VLLVKSVALSIFTIASTTPNSKAFAAELTFITCPAVPSDNEAPRPP